MIKILLILLAVMFSLIFLWASTFTGGFAAYMIFGANDVAVLIGAVIGGLCACSQIHSIFCE